MARRCNHKMTRYDWGRDATGAEVAISRWCLGCGAQLGIGPSNDEPLEVMTEVDAAFYAITYLEDDGWSNRLCGHSVGRRGWVGHATGGDIPIAGDAGWLAREMFDVTFLETHDFGRGAGWSWSISRPIAEQLAETARSDAAADRLLADLDAMEYEVTRSAEPDCRDEDEDPIDGARSRSGHGYVYDGPPVTATTPCTLTATERKAALERLSPTPRYEDEADGVVVCSCAGDALRSERCEDKS